MARNVNKKTDFCQPDRANHNEESEFTNDQMNTDSFVNRHLDNTSNFKPYSDFQPGRNSQFAQNLQVVDLTTKSSFVEDPFPRNTEFVQFPVLPRIPSSQILIDDAHFARNYTNTVGRGTYHGRINMDDLKKAVFPQSVQRQESFTINQCNASFINLKDSRNAFDNCNIVSETSGPSKSEKQFLWGASFAEIPYGKIQSKPKTPMPLISETLKKPCFREETLKTQFTETTARKTRLSSDQSPSTSRCNSVSGQLQMHEVTPRTVNCKQEKDVKKYDTSLFTCRLCKRSYYEEWRYDKHVATVHMKGGYKCHVCDGDFSTIPYFNDHNYLFHNMWCMCCVCGLLLKNMESLDTHKNENHRVIKCIPSCNVCNQNLARQNSHGSINRPENL